MFFFSHRDISSHDIYELESSLQQLLKKKSYYIMKNSQSFTHNRKFGICALWNYKHEKYMQPFVFILRLLSNFLITIEIGYTERIL